MFFFKKIKGWEGKVKAIPIQVSTSPKGSRRLRLLILRHLTHEDTKVVSPKHWPSLPPENFPGTYFC